ncbi:MAG: hypothetical protein WCE64_02590 [Bacteroidales bacterium]
MRNTFLTWIIASIIILCFSFQGKCIDSLKYYVSFNYYRDLSDTYDGGSLLSGELKLKRSWYGAAVSYGFFQSHSVFTYTIIVEDIGRTLTIPFDEISTMSSASLSVIMTPVKNRVLNVDLLLGFAFSKARSLQFHDVEYSYSFQDEKYNYLFKNYELVKATHSGFQFGFDLSLSVTKRLGLQVSTRIRDLSNGGTFFFVGSGVCFRL